MCTPELTNKWFKTWSLQPLSRDVWLEILQSCCCTVTNRYLSLCVTHIHAHTFSPFQRMVAYLLLDGYFIWQTNTLKWSHLAGTCLHKHCWGILWLMFAYKPVPLPNSSSFPSPCSQTHCWSKHDAWCWKGPQKPPNFKTKLWFDLPFKGPHVLRIVWRRNDRRTTRLDKWLRSDSYLIYSSRRPPSILPTTRS